MIRQNK